MLSFWYARPLLSCGLGSGLSSLVWEGDLLICVCEPGSVPLFGFCESVPGDEIYREICFRCFAEAGCPAAPKLALPCRF